MWWRSRFNWAKLFSYGEVVCFISAWVVCLLLTAASDRSDDRRPTTRSFVTTGELSGIQTTMRR